MEGLLGDRHRYCAVVEAVRSNVMCRRPRINVISSGLEAKGSVPHMWSGGAIKAEHQIKERERER